MTLDYNPELSDAPERDGEEPKKRTVCFVCSGNTCRSPMAAAVFNDMARRREICSANEFGGFEALFGLHAASAGLYPTPGSPIAANAALALSQSGIPSLPDNDYLSHASRLISEELVGECEYVIGVTREVTSELLRRFPGYATRLYTMPRDIADPFGGDLPVYLECLRQIKEQLAGMAGGR